MPRNRRPMRTSTPPVLVQPRRRQPDLSGLPSDELGDLRAFVVRLQQAGGFDPRTIRLTLSCQLQS